MFPIFRLIALAIKGVQRLNTSTEPALNYSPGISRYDKSFFDAEYPFQFYKYPLDDMPNHIEYYQAKIRRMTLVRKQSSTFFEIYETHVISPNELALNVRMCYADFVQTGISSKQHSVVTQNEFFVLCINDKLNQLEVKSSIDNNITERNIKKDFGDYLMKYLLKVKWKELNPMTQS